MPGPLRRIGIGIGSDPEKVIRSIRETGLPGVGFFCYCLPGTVLPGAPDDRVEIVTSPDPGRALVEDLVAGKIGAAVRGTLPSNSTLRALKLATGVDRLERIALLETAAGTKFLLAPVGVDEGWSVEEKLSLIEKGRTIAEKLGLPRNVAVLSGGRLGDIGRHPRVDASIEEAKLVAQRGDATHYQILIEDAVKECGLVIAPDGISGNLIFRTLTLIGGGQAHGAPVVNIDGIFVDTSRASPNYTNALLLAVSLLE